ncbi:predicted GPI-anchored protein 58 [Miscanthus floridulus]|uniref:predicted GPI-anchored protein 58 n=1 Tax=Miscanthus floridulus TaxID=154761 RepID=UPI00345A54D6
MSVSTVVKMAKVTKCPLSESLPDRGEASPPKLPLGCGESSAENSCPSVVKPIRNHAFLKIPSQAAPFPGSDSIRSASLATPLGRSRLAPPPPPPPPRLARAQPLSRHAPAPAPRPRRGGSQPQPRPEHRVQAGHSSSILLACSLALPFAAAATDARNEDAAGSSSPAPAPFRFAPPPLRTRGATTPRRPPIRRLHFAGASGLYAGMDREALEEGINTIMLRIATGLLNKKPRKGEQHLGINRMVEAFTKLLVLLVDRWRTSETRWMFALFFCFVKT